jgi:hypothetical protein
MSGKDDSDEYEYYIVHDGIRVSHVVRHRKGVHPAIRCTDCDEASSTAKSGQAHIGVFLDEVPQSSVVPRNRLKSLTEIVCRRSTAS